MSGNPPAEPVSSRRAAPTGTGGREAAGGGAQIPSCPPSTRVGGSSTVGPPRVPKSFSRAGGLLVALGGSEPSEGLVMPRDRVGATCLSFPGAKQSSGHPWDNGGVPQPSPPHPEPPKQSREEATRGEAERGGLPSTVGSPEVGRGCQTTPAPRHGHASPRFGTQGCRRLSPSPVTPRWDRGGGRQLGAPPDERASRAQLPGAGGRGSPPARLPSLPGALLISSPKGAPSPPQTHA